MSEKDVTPKPDAPVPVAPIDAGPPPAGPETQSERWLKYGVNVALTSLVVIVLAGIVVWAAQGTQKSTEKLRGRKDLTSDGSNALKPQTVEVIRDLPADTPVTLVSLYPKLKKEEASDKGADTYQKVLDVLDEYRRNGKNITVEAIDPIADAAKLGGWLEELKRRYGANMAEYEKVFKTEAPAFVANVRKEAGEEGTRVVALISDVQKLDRSQLSRAQLRKVGVSFQVLVSAAGTMQQFEEDLGRLDKQMKEELNKPIPDYAQATAVLKSILGDFSGGAEQLATALDMLKADAPAAEDPAAPAGQPATGPAATQPGSAQPGSAPSAATAPATKPAGGLPENIRLYIEAAVPRLRAMKKSADDLLARAGGLGDLKLTDIRSKILPATDKDAATPAVVVMGPKDVRVIDDFSLWKGGTGSGLGGASNEKPRLRFAGEQQLTSAILGLAQKTKPKVAFVRAGGEPKTTFGMGGPGPYGELAERLRAYNFEVVEKDFAPSPRQQPMPTAGEPSDADLKAAVWVVFADRPDQRMAMMGMPPPTGVLGEKLKAHLNDGGAALCLLAPEGDDLSAALADWGVEAKTNVVLVHEKVKGGNGRPDDFVEQARRQPFIWVLNEFGDSPVTSTLRSLDAAVVPAVQVKKAATVPAGVTVTEIIPMPTTPKSWGETDLASLQGSDPRRPPADPTFDPAVDAPAPVYAGAIAERPGKGRLVVIGSQNMFTTDLLTLTDPNLEKAKTLVSRFPANGELFTNSVFWLAKNEKMIALSPSAMDAARVEAVPPGKLGLIRVGIVLVALPLLAVAAGVGIWFTRRG